MPAKIGDRPDESCPVCKQSTYLNPNMKFKINPDCYHRMCDSCIERIFAAGPAPCPVAGCKKTLRRKGFRTQTFGDLTIERECDIRRRVNSILNRREEDFETLRDFNDYQEKKEELTWKLIYNEDVATVEKQLKQYSNENKDSITLNMEREDNDREHARLVEQQRAQRAAQGREEFKKEMADERAAKGAKAQEVVNSIRNADGDPEEAARRARLHAEQQQPHAKRTDRTESDGQVDKDKAQSRGMSFAGLRKTEKQAPQGPYDPFDGLRLITKHYNFRQDGSYRNSHLKEARTNTEILAGGYTTFDYCKHAIFDAHSGLGVMIGKEKAQAVT